MQQGHKSFGTADSKSVAKTGPQVLDLATLEQISGGGPHGGWGTTAVPEATTTAVGDDGPHGGWASATAGPHGGW